MFVSNSRGAVWRLLGLLPEGCVSRAGPRGPPLPPNLGPTSLGAESELWGQHRRRWVMRTKTHLALWSSRASGGQRAVILALPMRRRRHGGGRGRPSLPQRRGPGWGCLRSMESGAFCDLGVAGRRPSSLCRLKLSQAHQIQEERDTSLTCWWEDVSAFVAISLKPSHSSVSHHTPETKPRLRPEVPVSGTRIPVPAGSLGPASFPTASHPSLHSHFHLRKF